MPTARERAQEYRKEAKACLEVAERMSLASDRDRVLAMAKHWLELAAQADAKDRSGQE